ncbi:MAG: hypothetical protein KatS3mg114_0611 [Planctomycetaceae bacterium]|nr:MAG: hypothetical protein KatS3mg114_0611 [Planctomycetaceae bacterium]
MSWDRWAWGGFWCWIWCCYCQSQGVAQTPDAIQDTARRQQLAQRFHVLAVQSPGILLPLYVYPDEQGQRVYRTVAAAKQAYPRVPMWVIVNPADGPGRAVDEQYQAAINRLRAAGCVLLGYVATGYRQRPRHAVQADIQRWRTFYPQVQGVFFDELEVSDTDEAELHQAELSRYAQALGYWPLVGNPGTIAPQRFFDRDWLDVIVIHEEASWPDVALWEKMAKAGIPRFQRAALIHSDQRPQSLAHIAPQCLNHLGWIYVTDDRLQDGTSAGNPWDSLSSNFETLCRLLNAR